MAFRTIVITNRCKCSYSNGYLVIRDDQTAMIHVTEIECIIFDTVAVSVTLVLLNELINNKVAVIFCNEKHLPSFTFAPFSNTSFHSGRIRDQANWSQEIKDCVWKRIVHNKIINQGKLIGELGGKDLEKTMIEYAETVEDGDIGNKEAISAKVYFSFCFDPEFKRHDNDSLNACLNYGYAILLSICSQVIVSHGYINPLGIHHKSEHNPFNFACDIMEPLRPLIDAIAFKYFTGELNIDIKKIFWNLPSLKIKYKDKQYYLIAAIDIYARDIFRSLKDSSYLFEEIELPCIQDL